MFLDSGRAKKTDKKEEPRTETRRKEGSLKNRARIPGASAPEGMSGRAGRILVLLFWLALWQAAASLIGNDIIFVGPVQVLKALAEELPEKEFWLSLGFSVLRICLGFFLAFLLAVLTGTAAFFLGAVRQLLSPAVLLMKSIPVASFVILALIWTGPDNLSVFISFMVVFPMIYESTLSGLESADPALLEMASVFCLSRTKTFCAVYLPALLPYLAGSCRFALGMGFKSGVAAEVIGIPELSIGEQLYTAKIYLETSRLFAWTLVIIVITWALERLLLLLMEALMKRLGNREVNP